MAGRVENLDQYAEASSSRMRGGLAGGKSTLAGLVDEIDAVIPPRRQRG